MTLPDGLRAVAALMVILPHSVGLFAYWSSPSIPTRVMIRLALFGQVGVQVFFVLSGFVIAYTLRGRHLTARAFINFILRRSIRLDPPYWVAIALYCAYLIFRRSVVHTNITLPSPEQLVSHLFYLQDILGYGDLNVVFWTLCIEIQFYLVFCLLLGVSQQFNALNNEMRWGCDKLLFVILYVLSLAWPAHFLSAHEPATGLFFPHWYAFLLGAIVWWGIEGSIRRWVGHGAVLLLFAIGAAQHQREGLVVSCTASVILIAAYRHSLYRWLNVWWIQFLGKISYSIYLVHAPIAGVILGLQVRIAPRSQFVSFLMLAIVIVATIGLAFILNRFIEEPSLRLSRRFKTTTEDEARITHLHTRN